MQRFVYFLWRRVTTCAAKPIDGDARPVQPGEGGPGQSHPATSTSWSSPWCRKCCFIMPRPSPEGGNPDVLMDIYVNVGETLIINVFLLALITGFVLERRPLWIILLC